MIEVIVGTVLYNDSSKDRLMDLIWDQWTPEQHQALADEAHRAAMEKMGTIVEARLFKLGTHEHRPNLFANHVYRVVMDTFKTDNVEATVKSVVKEHLDEAIAGLKDKVTEMTTELVKRVVIEAMGKIEGYVLRDTLRTITSEAKGR